MVGEGSKSTKSFAFVGGGVREQRGKRMEWNGVEICDHKKLLFRSTSLPSEFLTKNGAHRTKQKEVAVRRYCSRRRECIIGSW